MLLTRSSTWSLKKRNFNSCHCRQIDRLLIRSGIFNNEADDTTSIRSTATKSYGLTDASLIKRSLNAAERQLELLARDAETEEVKPSVQTQPSKQPKAKRHRRGCRHRK
ncbi:hypothetical protein M3Y94_00632300 [Aphelenchoides besseyi]|nr:hypothetical protein M3Y94_00632300 [Aphelenchoides besseyi]